MQSCRIRLTTLAAAAPPGTARRRGAFMIMALFCFIACLFFVCLSVDVGYLGVEKTRMQNAVDAAALAAAQELTNAVQTAPAGTQNMTAYALAAARTVAAKVAQMNGVYVDPQADVQFGLRTYNQNNGTYSTNWNAANANVVKVTARRTSDNVAGQDGKLKLFFAGVTGDQYAKVSTNAVAYIECRDMVVVHDFSRSMNFDSHFSDESVTRLSDAQIVSNLHMLWSDLNLSLGNFTFTPQPLTLTSSSNNVSATVTFRFDKLSVSTNGTLKSVKVRYNNNTEQTWSNLSGTSIEITGTRDITNAWVTAQSNGSTPWSQTTNGITVTASGNRRSIDVAAGNKLYRIIYTFSDNTTYTENWSYGAGPNSFSYSSSKTVSSVRVYAPANVIEAYLGTNTLFTVPAPSSGVQVEQQFDDTNDNVRAAFGLANVNYPYPSGSWNEYFNHCRNYAPLASRGYRETYGGLTFANYVLRVRSSHAETPAICQARHYPFSSIKEGHTMLCQFLGDLSFGDHLGMVSFDSSHRVEKVQNETGLPYVNITSNPLTNDYTAIDNLMKYKQANHYSAATNMGGGLRDGIWLLDNYKRAGARPTIILMTDGNPNAMDSGENGTLPSGWNWHTVLDYDNNGVADYTTSDTQKRFVLKVAYEAALKGYTIHTMSVGMDGDRDLMKAIAHIGGGYFIDIPGGFSVLDMEEDVKAAFHKIASFVPPPRLVPAD